MALLSPQKPSFDEYMQALSSFEVQHQLTEEEADVLFKSWLSSGSSIYTSACRQKILLFFIEKGAKPWDDLETINQMVNQSLSEVLVHCLKKSPMPIPIQNLWVSKFITNKNFEVLKAWTENGFDLPSWRDVGPIKDTALHLAPDAETVDFLLRSGCNPDLVNAQQQTPLERWDLFLMPISKLHNKGEWRLKVEALIQWGLEQEQGLYRRAFDALPVGLVACGDLNGALAWTGLTRFGWGNAQLGKERLGMSPLLSLFGFLNHPSSNPSQGKNVTRIIKKCWEKREDIWDTEWASWGLFLQSIDKEAWLDQTLAVVGSRQKELEYQPTGPEGGSNRWRDALSVVSQMASVFGDKGLAQKHHYKATYDWMTKGAFRFNGRAELAASDWHLCMRCFQYASPDQVLERYFRQSWVNQHYPQDPAIKLWNFLEHRWPSWARGVKASTQEILLKSRMDKKWGPPEGLNLKDFPSDIKPEFKSWFQQHEINQATTPVSHTSLMRRI